MAAVAGCALYGAAIAVLNGPASGQTFPGRTITIVVPYAPGGTADVAARVLSEPLAATLGQTVIVENVSGGNALIGTGRGARAAPEGYTLLVHQMAIAASVSLFPKASFNVEKDLTAAAFGRFSASVAYRLAVKSPNPAALSGRRLFDDFVRDGEYAGWNGETERLGGLEVDDELERGRRQDGQIAWFFATQDSASISADLAKGIGEARAIGHQASR